MENDGSIIFHSEAFAELEQAHTWYEEQAPGIGDVFFQEVQYAVARIHETRKHGLPIRTEQKDSFFTGFLMR